MVSGLPVVASAPDLIVPTCTPVKPEWFVVLYRKGTMPGPVRPPFCSASIRPWRVGFLPAAFSAWANV